jgi:hypothetical protein
VSLQPTFGYKPELMSESCEVALRMALQRYYETDMKRAWPAAYDARKKEAFAPSDIDLIVLPLDRIGAPAGASRALVFVAYFAHRGDPLGTPQHDPSPPVIVKIGEAGELAAEFTIKRKWPTLPADVDRNFAIPHRLDKVDTKHWILIAPFQSDFEPVDGRQGIRLRDLWSILNDKDELLAGSGPDWSRLQTYISNALDTIHRLHRANHPAYRRLNQSYAKSYDWYLRDTKMVRKSKGTRAFLPAQLFGSGRVVTAFQQTWPNPVGLISKLMKSSSTFEGAYGPVHGDLHPKNIVLGRGDSVQIIDFGWSRTSLHIVVDYVLLDINIRALTLPSQISRTEILQIAKLLRPTDDMTTLSDVLRPRAELIKGTVWSAAESKGAVQDWDSEYLIPLFIVAYGLLVHLDSARNQSALVATVLAAAEAIEGPVHG